MQSPPLTRPPKRRITVYYPDHNGVQQQETRVVFWLRGFGYYIRWGRHQIIVNPLDEQVTVPYPLGT